MADRHPPDGGLRFRGVLIAAGILGLVTISDGFLYLGLQRQADLDTTLFPLLFTATSFAYMVLAMPMGWIADRFGRARTFIAGHVMLAALYGSLLLPTGGGFALIGYLVAFGAFYAATDGVLSALGSASLPGEVQATGLALLLTVTSLARLAGSVIFGAVWTAAGFEAAVRVFFVGLVIGILVAAYMLFRSVRPGGADDRRAGPRLGSPDAPADHAHARPGGGVRRRRRRRHRPLRLGLRAGRHASTTRRPSRRRRRRTSSSATSTGATRRTTAVSRSPRSTTSRAPAR